MAEVKDKSSPLASNHEAPLTESSTAPDRKSPTPPSTSQALTKPTNSEDATVTYFTNADGKRVKRIVRKKKRPARPQVDPDTIETSKPPPQTGTIFNIWYNKWSGGDREDSYLSKHHAPNRCNVAQDTGYTRADSVEGAYICLFFARGICPRGQECEYLHRLPSTFEINSGHMDCFGREKHSDYRDDMGGVGSFMRQNRTLYVGHIKAGDDIEERVARHFAEWGPIERIRVLARGVAFVTYTTESFAEFAKEAMAHQSLDDEETLNVRWATVDPNPVSQKREVRKIEEQAADAIRRALPEAFVKEIEGDPGAKRRRLNEGSFGLEGYKATDEVWFQSQKNKMAVEAGETRAILDAPEEQRLIENGSAPDAQSGEGDHANNSGPKDEEQGGILGASTLAALGKFKPQSNGEAASAKAKSRDKSMQSKGPLVSYGADDDDDEWN